MRNPRLSHTSLDSDQRIRANRFLPSRHARRTYGHSRTVATFASARRKTTRTAQRSFASMGFGPEEGSMTPDIAAEFLGLCADEGLADAPPDPLEKIFGHLALASHGIDADVLTADAAPHDAAMAKIYADLERNEKENPAGILAKASSSSTRILEKRFRHKDARSE